MLNKSQSYVVGQAIVLYSPDWTNIGFSFIVLTVNLFRHPILINLFGHNARNTVFGILD